MEFPKVDIGDYSPLEVYYTDGENHWSIARLIKLSEDLLIPGEVYYNRPLPNDYGAKARWRPVLEKIS